MIYEVEGGGVGTGETAGGSPIPGSVERSPSQGTFQSHLKTLTRQLLGTDEGGTMELLSVSITPRYHLRTSVEHDYWKQNNADRISHPGLGQKNSKDVRAPTSPLPALRPPHPPHHTTKGRFDTRETPRPLHLQAAAALRSGP